MNGQLFSRTMGGLCSIIIVFHAPVVLAQTESQNREWDVICITDRPAIVEGESTNLQAWLTTQDGQLLPQPASFLWQVTEGTVLGTGPEVQWELSHVKIEPKESRKTVTATAKTGHLSCVVEVVIEKQEPAGSEGSTAATRDGRLRSARKYLFPNETEKPGFGLYSYLLFPERPRTEKEKALYVKTVESCLRMMESVEEHLAIHRETGELNATHIPVKMAPKSSEGLSDWAANVLAVYDYTTAQKLLDKLGNEYRQGPYLIAVLKPLLSERKTPVQEYLLGDFTSREPKLASQVVELFTYRAAQQRTWMDESLRSFRLNVRNLVAVAGKVAPEVASAMIVLVKASQLR